MHGDFSSGSVVKNLSDSAGDTNSIPGPGIKIPYTLGQLIPTTNKQLLTPVRLEPVLCTTRSHYDKKPAHHNPSVTPAHCNRRKPVWHPRPSTAKKIF